MTKRQSVKKTLDTAFSLYIRARDGNRCYTCGSTIDIQCGHLITRERTSARWDPRNAKAQCERCNSIHEEDPAPFVEKWIEEHGEDQYQRLLKRSWQPAKYSIDDMRELIRSFRTMTVELEKRALLTGE